MIPSYAVTTCIVWVGVVFSVYLLTCESSSLPFSSGMCRNAPRLVASQANSHPNHGTQVNANKNMKCINILSQNVRGIKFPEQLEMLVHAFSRRGLFAACLQETWREGSEQLLLDGVRIISIGPEKQTGRGSQGVAIALGQEGFECWKAAGFELHNNFGARLIAMRLIVSDCKNNEVGLYIISAYAPVGNDDDVIWEQYLTDLNQCISRKRAGDMLIIGTDTNASFGRKAKGDTREKNVGLFGIDHVNDSGRRFRTFLSCENLFVFTTMFQKRSYGTWIHPRRKNPPTN